ncbi:MAG: XisI protein [Leptospiraceae bacterium]|nr:XisI protein [Leptospiraceae bacterium]MCP5499222.1 XisI protein [Leptospiraceae bacterium]
MDKIKKYSEAIIKLIRDYGKFSPVNRPDTETQVIIDAINHHYLIYLVGWKDEDTRIHDCYLHIDIKEDGKIWIQYNGFDRDMEEEFEELGIDNNDVVLGFYSESYREMLTL